MIDYEAFSGADRLEHVPAFARVFRIGEAEALYASDPERLRALLAKEPSGAETREYLAYFHGLNLFMLEFIYEWVVRWPGVIERVLGKPARAACVEAALKDWCAAAAAWDGPETKGAFDDFTKLLSAETLDGGALARFEQAKAAPGWTCPACAGPRRAFAALSSAPDLARFDAYLIECRARHDLMLRLTWCFGSAVLAAGGQAAAAEALRGSLQECAPYELIFELAMNLSPRGMAAFLAEHLRSHFSGPGREGKVRVIEEADCFRLVVDACGSGGAMRRQWAAKPAAGFAKLPEAAPCTWGRAGEVPVYCAHCAQNELASMKRMGFPVLVTAFDPDASKPCGWTIYKSPELIPEQFFARLGMKKDPSKFRTGA